MVLVHGSAVDGHTWDGVVPELSQTIRSLRTISRGYGKSVPVHPFAIIGCTRMI